ncbi:hypothetical protein HAX54_049178 [Datura stramonium]|uniref:Uncharacterized protein n=1 Tax=Datura stramonium TaxID=4076 RepID=A0ABS8WP12_DATST|nr:hypothetical protein [Datura stramonium]
MSRYTACWKKEVQFSLSKEQRGNALSKFLLEFMGCSFTGSEVLEHVGDEFREEFFTCCESALAEDGLLVLQFILMPDPMYDEYRHSAGFIKAYIFSGGCLPALSRVTSAMAAASRPCHIRALGFDDKFIRTWEYYFDYCAAGFKTCTLGDYQAVFSRPGNVATFGDPYNVTLP